MLYPSDFEHDNDSPCPLSLTHSGDKQTIGGLGKSDAPDPERTFGLGSRRAGLVQAGAAKAFQIVFPIGVLLYWHLVCDPGE